jgi:plastocyanin
VGRSALLLGVLCVVGGAFVAIAIAAPRHTAGHRSSHAGRACHRAKHRHCQRARIKRRSRNKHGIGKTSKPSKPTSSEASSTAPWSAPPSSVGLGSASGSAANPVGPVSNPPPVESPAVPVTPTHVEVTAEDNETFRFVLSRPTVPAGKVIIEFVNHGQDEHNLNAVEPTAESVAGSLPNAASNAHLSLTVDLHPGSYTLFCSLPGHEAKGMKATLVVE